MFDRIIGSLHLLILGIQRHCIDKIYFLLFMKSATHTISNLLCQNSDIINVVILFSTSRIIEALLSTFMQSENYDSVKALNVFNDAIQIKILNCIYCSA